MFLVLFFTLAIGGGILACYGIFAKPSYQMRAFLTAGATISLAMILVLIYVSIDGNHQKEFYKFLGIKYLFKSTLLHLILSLLGGISMFGYLFKGVTKSNTGIVIGIAFTVLIITVIVMSTQTGIDPWLAKKVW